MIGEPLSNFSLFLYSIYQVARGFKKILVALELVSFFNSGFGIS